MATTPINGSSTFPTTENEFYTAVETLAEQNIREVKNTNRIEDAFFEYEIENGKVIEEAIVEMAEKQAFVNKGNPDFSPIDPKLHVKYFNNFETAQWETTTRKDDIRAIIANKSASVESVTANILATLSEGEGNADFKEMASIMTDASVGVDASKVVFGSAEAPKVATNMKAVVWGLRELFNKVKATNKVGTALDIAQSCPIDDIRIAVSEDLLNLIDVVELANIFNLSKEELFGKLVVVPTGEEYPSGRVMVYDRKALGRATRVYDYTQDVIGKGRYINHYLTTERAYFYNDMFKCFYWDCSKAVASAKTDLLTDA